MKIKLVNYVLCVSHFKMLQEIDENEELWKVKNVHHGKKI